MPFLFKWKYFFLRKMETRVRYELLSNDKKRISEKYDILCTYMSYGTHWVRIMSYGV